MSLKRTKLYIFGGNAGFSNKSIVKNHLALKGDCSDGRNGILNLFLLFHFVLIRNMYIRTEIQFRTR